LLPERKKGAFSAPFLMRFSIFLSTIIFNYQPKADMNPSNKKTIYKRKWFKVA